MKNVSLTDKYCRSDIEKAIYEWINGDNSERNRMLLKLKLFKGYSFEKVAEICKMSPKQARKEFHRCEDIIYKHIPG